MKAHRLLRVRSKLIPGASRVGSQGRNSTWAKCDWTCDVASAKPVHGIPAGSLMSDQRACMCFASPHDGIRSLAWLALPISFCSVLFCSFPVFGPDIGCVGMRGRQERGGERCRSEWAGGVNKGENRLRIFPGNCQPHLTASLHGAANGEPDFDRHRCFTLQAHNMCKTTACMRRDLQTLAIDHCPRHPSSTMTPRCLQLASAHTSAPLIY